MTIVQHAVFHSALIEAHSLSEYSMCHCLIVACQTVRDSPLLPQAVYNYNN